MSAGFCLHCGLRIDTPTAMPPNATLLHPYCIDAWNADQIAATKRPKTLMEQQLDRIEGLLMAIRDRYSL